MADKSIRLSVRTIVVLFIVAAVIAGGVFAFINIQRWKGWADIYQAQAEDSQASLEAAQAELEQSKAQSGEALATLQASLDETKDDLKEAQTSISQANSRASQAERLLWCDRRISSPKFRDNMTIGGDLREWVEDGGNHVTSVFWRSIWTGKKFAVYTVEDEHADIRWLWTFVVMFRSDGEGQPNGIFNADEGCWLYLDK